MISSLLKIIARKRGFVLVSLSLILVSLTVFHLVLQVGVLVDKNVEYQFREYRPHVVYFTRFTLPKAATSKDYPLTNDIWVFEDSLEKTLNNENFSAHTLVGFPWSYINPIRVRGKQVNIVVYLTDNFSSLKEFGFNVENNRRYFPENAVVVLDSNLTPGMDSKTILSRFFDRNVSVLNATRTALSYPLLSSRDYGVLYIQVAAPLKDWAVNACLNHIRKSLVESSGLDLLVYTAVNFEHPINNVSRLESMVKETIPNRIFPKALWNAYRGVRLYHNRTVYLDIRSPTSNRRVFYSNGTCSNYSTSELWTLVDNGSIVIPTTVSVEQKDILDLLKDSGEYVLKFFVEYSGLLVALYLPLFMLLIYASSRFYQQLMEDLNILSLRGISGNPYRVVDLTIFVACTLAVLASYGLVITIYSKAPSALVAGAVILVSYSTVLLSKKINGRGLRNRILPLLTAAFIILGYLRINNEVLMAKGWGFLVIFLAFLYALTPLMGVYHGVLSEQVVRKLVELFQSRNPLPYYERILKEYTLVLAFSAYALAIGLLPKFVSLKKVTDKIAGSSDYFNLVGYSNVSILGLLSEYLKELALIFGIVGLVAGVIILSIMLSKYKEARKYSKLRGIDEATLKKQTMKSLLVFVLILTASTAAMLLLVALFTDAYVGFNYTEGKIVVEGGKFVVKSLFKPPHIFIWGR